MAQLSDENLGELFMGTDFDNDPNLPLIQELSRNREEYIEELYQMEVKKNQLKKLMFVYKELMAKKLTLQKLSELDELGNLKTNIDTKQITEQEDKLTNDIKNLKSENKTLQTSYEDKVSELVTKYEHVKQLNNDYEKLFEKFENGREEEDEFESNSQDTPMEKRKTDNTQPLNLDIPNLENNLINDDEDNPKTEEDFFKNIRKRLSFSDNDMKVEETNNESVIINKTKEEMELKKKENKFKFLQWVNGIKIIEYKDYKTKQVLTLELSVNNFKMEVLLTLDSYGALQNVQYYTMIGKKVSFNDIIKESIARNDISFLLNSIMGRMTL
ncbi:hypothetical protein ABK040_008783 [Willaertia magna]